MDQLRKLYTQEDGELIEKFMEAKTSFNSKPENFALTSVLEGKDLFGKHDLSPSPLTSYLKVSPSIDLMNSMITCAINCIDAILPPRTFPKDLNNDQLVMMLSKHPKLMGTDYLQDIGKLKGKQS